MVVLAMTGLAYQLSSKSNLTLLSALPTFSSNIDKIERLATKLLKNGANELMPVRKSLVIRITIVSAMVVTAG